MTARDLLAEATARLQAAGVESARVDAELLLAGVLATSRANAVLRDSVDALAAATFASHVARRAAREPLQYIVGEAPFRHVVLEVGPGVFVPRPETELLVDAVLPHLRTVAEPLVVDLCSGSGALALAVADEVPAARVVAVERSAGALRWLTRNATPAVQVVAADVTDPDLLREFRGRVDAVICNPPYVPSGVAVAPEVHADPAEAVFGGADGLDLIPTVVRRAAELLSRGGVFAMEHDESQADEIGRMLAANHAWTEVAGHEDLTGRARFVTARASGRSSAD